MYMYRELWYTSTPCYIGYSAGAIVYMYPHTCLSLQSTPPPWEIVYILSPYIAFLQVEVLLNHFKVFDVYKKKFLIGEMIWNFADFQTGQCECLYKSLMCSASYTYRVHSADTGRANGNRKGIFTRQRRPKASAHFVRQRYHSLSQNKDLCFGYTLTGAFKECQSS